MTVLYVSPEPVRENLPGRVTVSRASGVLSAIGQISLTDFDLVIVDEAGCRRTQQPTGTLIDLLRKRNQPYAMVLGQRGHAKEAEAAITNLIEHTVHAGNHYGWAASC